MIKEINVANYINYCQEIINNLGKRLNDLGITEKEFAKRYNINYFTLNRVIKEGFNDNRSFSLIIKIVRGLEKEQQKSNERQALMGGICDYENK